MNGIWGQNNRVEANMDKRLNVKVSRKNCNEDESQGHVELIELDAGAEREREKITRE